MLQPVPTFPVSPPHATPVVAPVLDWLSPQTWRDRLVYLLLASTLVLNLLDASFTLFAVRSGLAVEANPLMDELLARGAITFMLGKVAMVSLGITLLWRLRWLRIAIIGSVAAFATYALIVVWHLHGLAG